MAIKETASMQQFRGPYSQLDKSKLLPGQFAFVTSGDPNTQSGRAIYACFAAGAVERIPWPNEVSSSGGSSEGGSGGNISGGGSGEDGGYYTPSVNSAGDLSWSASKAEMPAVETVNIKGPKGDALKYSDLTESQKAELKGAPGKSAYQYAQDGGYTGTEAEFTALMAAGVGGCESAGNGLPAVTVADVGKFLRVSDAGVWTAELIQNAEEVSF